MKRLDVQHVTETLSIVIRRMSLTLLNKSCLPRLMERIVSMRKVMNAATTTNDGDGAASSQMERRISLSRTQTVALRDVDDLRLGAAAESIIQVNLHHVYFFHLDSDSLIPIRIFLVFSLSCTRAIFLILLSCWTAMTRTWVEKIVPCGFRDIMISIIC